MTGTIPVGDDDLQAYADGRLSPDRRAIVAAYVAAHPEVSAKINGSAGQEASLRDSLQPKYDEPIPSRLRIASIQAQRRRQTTTNLSRAAAILLIAGLAGGGGWLARGWSNATDSLVSVNRNSIEAFNTFTVEIRHPVEVRADDASHLVQWLSTRLQRPLTLPDLTPLGYRLMGGRVLPTAGNPAALLMYNDDRGTRLTVYIQPMSAVGETFQTAEREDVRTIFWAERKLALAVTGRMPQAALLALARSIHDQMDRPDSATRL